MMLYLKPIWTAGYSGFVLYNSPDRNPVSGRTPCNYSIWMIPGTYHYDWDCR
jgi:hypothetical protein